LTSIGHGPMQDVHQLNNDDDFSADLLHFRSDEGLGKVSGNERTHDTKPVLPGFH
jgi:hypothetical protein